MLLEYCVAGCPDMNRLVGVVVKASAEDPGFESRIYLKIGTPVATLPGARSYRVSVGTSRPGDSIL